MERGLRRRSLRESSLKREVINSFRRAGWRVLSQPHIGDVSPELVVRRGSRQYVIELKSSPEARRDRLVPLLAQAILQAKASASKAGRPQRVLPLAVIGASNMSEPLINELRSFAAQVAPEVPIGIVDLQGSRVFLGRDFESLNEIAPRRKKSHSINSLAPPLHLFSDLNQWMLKVLLSPAIPDNLLRAPRERISSVSQLAKAAGVSPMSASRCVSLLRAEGFLDEQSADYRVVNIEALLDRWRAASRRPVREVPMRWIIPGQRERLLDALRAHANKPQSAMRAIRRRRVDSYPRLSLALFAAASALGFRFVHGVAAHLYVERFNQSQLEAIGLAPAHPGQRADVLIRVPSFRESVFRGAVVRDGVRVSDALQIWLDVADHPARGAGQAQEIWRRVLVPVVKHSLS